jgi:NAD(P)-dependent dehydrogenase (short-subunit alcohol dehydrogenase family)
LFDEDENIHTYELDLAKTSQIEKRMSEIRSNYGPILYVINNAAVNYGGTVEEVEEQPMLFSLRVNVIAPIKILQELLPAMKSHDFGRIINITSGAPLDIPDGAIPYTSSKAALNTSTVAAAQEFDEYDIKINLMSPGPTRSEMAPEAPLSPTACHPTVDYLLSLDETGPTGRFFWLGNEVPLFPDLGDVDWESGTPSAQMTRVLDDA